MRKRLFFCSLALFGLCVFSSSVSSKKKSKRYSCYHPRGDRSSLTLYDNGKFEQSRGNCTYQFSAKETWIETGDTISLTHEKIKHTFGHGNQSVERSTKIYVHTSDSMQYVWDREFGLSTWLVLSAK